MRTCKRCGKKIKVGKLYWKCLDIKSSDEEIKYVALPGNFRV